MLSTQLPLLAGLSTIYTDFVGNWAGPLFLIIVAAVSITFLLRREFCMLFGFLAIAVIVGVLIFFGDNFFGRSGKFTGIAKTEANKINMIVPYITSFIR